MEARPFLKWAGGKGQLIDRFERLFPAELTAGAVHNYCEPFIGGGAVFFHVAERYSIGRAYLSDLNPDLVVAYCSIQKDVDGVIARLRDIADRYAALPPDGQKACYYATRDAFNADRPDFDYGLWSDRWLQRTAWLLFLNRTCFNGLYRVNKSGEYNVPFGKYANPRILDEDNLRVAARLLSIADIRHADFAEVLRHAGAGAFVYFDPPYRPISRTSSFTSYSTSEFDDEQQRRLADVFGQLSRRGAKVMLSNSDPKNTNPDDAFFDELYADYEIARVPCRRAINSKAEGRGEISEIVVTNYTPTDTRRPEVTVRQSGLF